MFGGCVTKSIKIFDIILDAITLLGYDRTTTDNILKSDIINVFNNDVWSRRMGLVRLLYQTIII